MRNLALVLFISGFLYLIAPGPDSIDDIPPLPNSLKSIEPGDTIQNKNISAFFSNQWRSSVTNFYKGEFEKLNKFGFKIPAIRLNHPPEEAFWYIRDQQRTTYLEQFLYPLRGSLFVNGYEPINPQGKKFDSISVPVHINGTYYVSKTTLRFYPAPLHMRLIIYVACWLGLIVLFKLIKKVWGEN